MSERAKRGDRLAGKVALVTGAGAVGPGWGNGKATAVVYGREGAKVFAVDINIEAAEETACIVESEGGEATAWAADVTEPGSVAAMVEACMAAYGRIDVLHNNVGGVGAGPGAAHGHRRGLVRHLRHQRDVGLSHLQGGDPDHGGRRAAGRSSTSPRSAASGISTCR